MQGSKRIKREEIQDNKEFIGIIECIKENLISWGLAFIDDLEEYKYRLIFLSIVPNPSPENDKKGFVRNDIFSFLDSNSIERMEEQFYNFEFKINEDKFNTRILIDLQENKILKVSLIGLLEL